MTAQIETVDFFAFDNSYARLPDRFFARLRPTPVAAPRIFVNRNDAFAFIYYPLRLSAIMASWGMIARDFAWFGLLPCSDAHSA